MRQFIKFADILMLVLSILMLIFMFAFSDLMKVTVRSSLNICTTVIIPSLFPYIAATTLIANYLNSDKIYELLAEKKRKKILIIITIIIGILSGFPAGALVISKLYSGGIIEKKRAELLAGCFCNTSPAFCIYVFGVDFLGSKRLGLICFISIIISDFFAYFVLKKFAYNKSSSISNKDEGDNQLSKKDDVISFSESICNSIYTLINICGLITMFMCLSSVLKTIINFFTGYESKFLLFTVSILEITSGLNVLSDLSFGTKFLLGNVLMGSCGICGITQVCKIFNDNELKCGLLLKSKILTSVTVPTISTIILALFG